MSIITPVYEYYAETPIWRYQYSPSPDIGEGWKRSGVAFFAFGSGEPNTVPVYRFFAKDPWRYYYSTNSTPPQGWLQDGPAFYAYKAQPASGSIPLYQYSAQNPWRYQYSLKDDLVSSGKAPGWTFEDAAFYIFDATPAV
ncbi:MAG: hypothetical protein HC769_34905 [Cyanobacteria bacterium CRU_2_1]|nr:hypothetical protein [Cyanobacteria bacterium RU_5_0]NJR63517.1 hypothetical protein [Cyanobacteria bacterium CRU_2_1]